MKKLLLALFCLGLGFNASAQNASKPTESKPPRINVGDANPPTRAMSDADIDAQLALIKVQSEQIKELTRRVSDLEARIGKQEGTKKK